MDQAHALLCSGRFRRLASQFGVAARDVDDVAQEVLQRLWEKRAQFDPSGNVAAWAGQVAVNQARMHVRRARKRREDLSPFDDEHDAPDERPDPESEAIMRERVALLAHLIDQIHASRRQLFVEHKLLHKPLAKIADEQGIRLKTAEKRLALAWKDLRRAAARWEAEQRRRGLDAASLLPVGLDVRSWMARAAHALRGLRWRLFAFMGGLAVIVSAVLAMSPAFRTTLAPLPPIATPALAEGRPPAPHANATNSAPAVASSAVFASPARTAGRHSSREDTLIGQAGALLGACRLAEAREALAQHDREFPRGRLAPEREALQKTLNEHPGCPP